MSAADIGAAWDCHAHVFGPYGAYPLAAQRTYTPAEASQRQYEELLARLGMGHGVLVHPSAYGADYRLVLDALAAHPNWRGVLVMQAGSAHSLKQLRQLRAQGVRALRFSHRGGASSNFAGSASLDDLLAMAPALADAGLHAELWTDRQVLPSIAGALRALPVPVVLDHMAGFDANAGINEPGFAAMVQLLEEGRAWVKLCAYRNLLALPHDAWRGAGQVFHRALVRANPAQLLWGSDWPHLNVKPAPDTACLLDLFKGWIGEPAALQNILLDNPRRLYA